MRTAARNAVLSLKIKIMIPIAASSDRETLNPKPLKTGWGTQDIPGPSAERRN